MTCGLGLRPAICLAGSTPGVLKKIKNTSSVIANMVSRAQRVRRMMKFSTRAAAPGAAGMPGRRPQQVWSLPLHPQLGARIQRVADSVAQYVQRRHGQESQGRGCGRGRGGGGEKGVGVGGGGAGGGGGRGGGGGGEGGDRLGEDRGGNHQREQHD